jgi:hypothetical protein
LATVAGYNDGFIYQNKSFVKEKIGQRYSGSDHGNSFILLKNELEKGGFRALKGLFDSQIILLI